MLLNSSIGSFIRACPIVRAPIRAVLSLALIAVLPVLGGCERAVAQPLPETIPVAPTSFPSAIFPLHKQAGQRCLVDRKGQPYFLHGDAAWTLLLQLKRDDVERYLEDRRRRGFNALLVDLIDPGLGRSWGFGRRNAYGERPFVVPKDYTRPNEKYFAHVDWVLLRAAERGFLVLLTPSYLGYQGGDQGWYRAMRENGVRRLRAYGNYLGLRYRNMTNLIWVHGGDYSPPERGPMEAIMHGIRETNPAALHSFHGGRGTAARAFLGSEAVWLDVNTIYTDENSVVPAARSEYTASSLPFFLIEARYEGEGASEVVVRSQAYQAMLSGACGQVMGNKPIYSFDSGWQGALDSPGARSMTQMRSLLDTLDWAELRPAFEGFIVDGIGKGVMRAAAAISEDKRRAVVYVPSLREIGVNLGLLEGTKFSLRWIDPANAHSVPVRKSSFAGLQRLNLRPPGPNSSGYGDWILVLESRN